MKFKKSDKLECYTCVGRGGIFGPGAIEDLESSAMGGKPWRECWFCDGKGFIELKFNIGEKVIFKGLYDNSIQYGIIENIFDNCYFIVDDKNETINEVPFNCYIEPLKEPNDILKDLL